MLFGSWFETRERVGRRELPVWPIATASTTVFAKPSTRETIVPAGEQRARPAEAARSGRADDGGLTPVEGSGSDADALVGSMAVTRRSLSPWDPSCLRAGASAAPAVALRPRRRRRIVPVDAAAEQGDDGGREDER